VSTIRRHKVLSQNKAGRQAAKADRSTRQAGRQGRQADKAGMPPTRRAGQQGEQTAKAGTQGRQAGSIDVPTLTGNIFAAATNKTNIHNRTGTTHH